MPETTQRIVTPHQPTAPSVGTVSAVLLVLALAVGGTTDLALTGDQVVQPALQVLLGNWITIPYVVSGLIAWRRRPASRLGPLMIVTGFANALTKLAWSDQAVLLTVGQLIDMLPPALFLHVFLAYPTGVLPGRLDRVVVAACYAVGTGLQLVKALLGADSANLLAVASNQEAVGLAERVQLACVSLLLVAGIVILAVRRRRALGTRRRPARMLVDAFGLSLVMLALLFVGGLFSWPSLEILRQVTFGALGLAPVAFLVGLLDARLARSDVGRLLVELRADPAQDLRGPLARALHDPSVAVAYWLPEYDGWADRDGRQVQLPGPDEARAVRLVRRNGEPVAALLFDASLEDEDELLDAVDAAAGIALENARLQAELRARLQELQGSRRRVLEAGQQERQRLERDLHDGAQQRLIALSLELDELGRDSRTDAETRARLASLKREVAASLAELREVAHGLHPAALTSHGLAVALESLTARATVPVELSMDQRLGRLPEPVEVAAYYVVSEGLTNIAKHARANRAEVGLHLSDGVLEVTVADDGIGGADTEAGSGLRGLADRVEALDGHLYVWTPRGGGTRVEAVLPCR